MSGQRTPIQQIKQKRERPRLFERPARPSQTASTTQPTVRTTPPVTSLPEITFNQPGGTELANYPTIEVEENQGQISWSLPPDIEIAKEAREATPAEKPTSVSPPPPPVQMSNAPEYFDFGIERDQLQSGNLIERRFRVVRPLGAGGNAVAYLCRDVINNMDVVLKVAREGEDTGLAFETEFTVMEAIGDARQHNLVGFFGYGRNFLVLEYLDGRSIYDFIKTRGSLTPLSYARRSINIIRNLLIALGRIHREGFTHEDLSPGNCMILDDNCETLSLFDYATGLFNKLSHYHRSMIGTPRFIAPEQIDFHKRTDGRSDIYSVGTILYTMFAGRRPYEGFDNPRVLPQINERRHYPNESSDKEIYLRRRAGDAFGLLLPVINRHLAESLFGSENQSWMRFFRTSQRNPNSLILKPNITLEHLKAELLDPNQAALLQQMFFPPFLEIPDLPRNVASSLIELTYIMTAADPENRFQNCQQVLDQLDCIAEQIDQAEASS